MADDNMPVALPPEAEQYIQSLSTPEAKQEIDVEGAKKELLAWCNDFITKSKSWRDNSYQAKWEKWQRAADGVFDPEVAKAKKAWQSKVHVGLTAAHRESIHAYLFRVMCGTNPPLEIEPRFDLGEMDQSENIRDIILRELDKARWEIEIDKVMHDADTYGSGFVRRYWETKTAMRKLKKPIPEGLTDNLNPMGMVGFAKRAMTGQLKTVGYSEEEVEVITYRGLVVKHISIWDVFKTPKSMTIPGTTIAVRCWLKYGDIVQGVAKGYYLPDAAEKLRGLSSTKKTEGGQSTIEGDRGISSDNLTPPDYGMEHENFELFGRLPKKWIYGIQGVDINADPEELVSARVIFHKDVLLAVELNDEYDEEPPVHQMNYMTKNGDAYGIGIPEMLEDPQAVVNEIVNQRLDNGCIALNNTFGVVEKALVNPKQDLDSKPGQIIRFDSKYTNGDIRTVMTQLSINDTPLRAGFSEVNEWERFAQERTSANRMTLGTAGLVNDANQTLGGQEMLKQSAGEKFAYIGLVMEVAFLREFFHGVWKTVYKNMDPEDIENAIGPERMPTFIPQTPEEILSDYIYKPMGVFTMENKAKRQAMISEVRKQFVGAPWINDEKFFDAECRAADLDPDMFKVDKSEMMAHGMPGMAGISPMAGNPGNMAMPPIQGGPQAMA